MAAKSQSGKPAEKGDSGDGSGPGAAGVDEVITFEDAMDQIESIVAEMEADRVPLDKLLADYERGSRLVQLCQKHLEEAQERIEVIQAGGGDGRGSGGGPVLVPFGGAAAVDEEEENPPPARPKATRATGKAKKEPSGEPDDDIRLL